MPAVITMLLGKSLFGLKHKAYISFFGMSFLITFEGVEGSGKTTQIEKAGAFLAEQRLPFLVTREPGGTQVGTEIRKLLLNKTSLHLAGKAELLLFAADRAQHVEEVILPALREGKIVLCDRFADATVAYQGYGRGLEVKSLKMISDFASQSLKPHATFLFDTSVEQGLKRVKHRSMQTGNSLSNDRFEGEKRAFHQKVREGYLALARENSERYRVIDASQDIDTVYQTVCLLLSQLINR